MEPEYSISYKGTYLGTKKILTIGAGYQYEPDAVYGNVAGKNLAKDYKAYAYDVFFEYPTPANTFTVSGAYLKEDFDKAYQGADPDPRSIGLNGEKKGWYSKAGYMLPNKIGNANLQFFGRYEYFKSRLDSCRRRGDYRAAELHRMPRHKNTDASMVQK